MGRWITTDPAHRVDGLNVYAFVKGNPISRRDSYGHDSFKIAEWTLSSGQWNVSQYDSHNSFIEKHFLLAQGVNTISNITANGNVQGSSRANRAVLAIDSREQIFTGISNGNVHSETIVEETARANIKNEPPENIKDGAQAEAAQKFKNLNIAGKLFTQRPMCNNCEGLQQTAGMTTVYSFVQQTHNGYNKSFDSQNIFDSATEFKSAFNQHPLPKIVTQFQNTINSMSVEAEKEYKNKQQGIDRLSTYIEALSLATLSLTIAAAIVGARASGGPLQTPLERAVETLQNNKNITRSPSVDDLSKAIKTNSITHLNIKKNKTGEVNSLVQRLHSSIHP